MPSLKKPNFGMRKKIILKDNDNQDYELVLEYNAMTPIYYMNFVGRDLMSDFIKATMPKNKDSLKGIEKISNIKTQEDILKLSNEELEQLMSAVNNVEYTQFLENFVAILFYTAHHKDNPDLVFDEIITDYLPDNCFYNEDIMKAINEILDFKLVGDLKKKVISQQVQKK